METHIKTKVEIVGGKTIEGIKGIKELSLVQSHNQHHTLELTTYLEIIKQADESNLLEGQNLVGQLIRVTFSPEKASKIIAFEQVFVGVVTGVGVIRHGINGADFQLKAQSPSILTDGYPNTRSFSQKTLKQIAEAVLSPYSSNLIKTLINPTPNPNLDFITQYEESDYNFLMRLAERFGQWFYYDGTQLVFGNKKDEPESDCFLGQDLTSFHLGIKLEPTTFARSSYDYVKNQPYDIQSSALNMTNLNQLGKHAVESSEGLFSTVPLSYSRQYFKDPSGLRAEALAQREGGASDLVTAEGSGVNPRLTIGSSIHVQTIADQKNADYGSFTIINIAHITNSLGTYQNVFKAIPLSLKTPPSFGLYAFPRADMQPAVVKENNDPDKMNRIRVQFMWQKSPEMSPWIRMISSHAGKNKGLQFIPEIGDEVMVAFENNNPDRPVVVGAVHHGNQKHEDRQDKDNHIKTIRTRSNNEIRFCDKPGEEEIIILNKDSKNEIRLSLKDNKILIKAEKTIEIIGEDIIMEASKSISLKTKDMTAAAQNSLKLESQNSFEVKNKTSKMESTSKSDIQSTGPISIKSSGEMKVEGMKTAIKASSQLELNGSAQATLKGGVVMIN